VDEAVEVTGRLLNLFPHVIIAVEVEDVGYEVESVLVVGYFCVEPREVEAVGQILFVDFAEVLISSGGNELSEELAVMFVVFYKDRRLRMYEDRQKRKAGRLRGPFRGFLSSAGCSRAKDRQRNRRLGSGERIASRPCSPSPRSTQSYACERGGWLSRSRAYQALTAALLLKMPFAVTEGIMHSIADRDANKTNGKRIGAQYAYVPSPASSLCSRCPFRC
jgi:hypothetical protein